jgi:hypothetical protein
LASQVYEEAGYKGAVLYLEEWESKPEFCEHVRSEHYRRILATMDLSESPPELCFHDVSATEGLELVQRLPSARKAAIPSGQKP